MQASIFIEFGDSSYHEMCILEGRNLYSLQHRKASRRHKRASETFKIQIVHEK